MFTLSSWCRRPQADFGHNYYLGCAVLQGLHPAIGVVELLEHLTLELGLYSELLQDVGSRDHSVFETRTLIKG